MGKQAELMTSKVMAEFKDPVQAAKELVPHKRPDVVARQVFTEPSTVQKNQDIFDQILADKNAPYKTIVDAMQTAMKTERFTTWEYDYKIEADKAITTYREVPDWNTRIAAAKTYLLLTGRDPKYEVKVKIDKNGINIEAGGSMWLSLSRDQSNEELLHAYNELKQRERQLKQVPAPENIWAIDAEFTIDDSPTGEGEQ